MKENMKSKKVFTLIKGTITGFAVATMMIGNTMSVFADSLTTEKRGIEQSMEAETDVMDDGHIYDQTEGAENLMLSDETTCTEEDNMYNETFDSKETMADVENKDDEIIELTTEEDTLVDDTMTEQDGMGVVELEVAEVAIKNITFPTAVTIREGECKTLSVKTSPENTTYKTNIEWEVQSNECFSYKVNGYGTYWNQQSSEIITGVKSGVGYLRTTVKVYDSNDKLIKKFDFRTKVTVLGKTDSISMSKTSLKMTVGDSTTLKMKCSPGNFFVRKNAEWKSSNTSVAIVENGIVTAKNAGTATITGVYDGKKTTCKIVIENPVNSISMTKSTLSLTEGKTETLKINCKPGDFVIRKKAEWNSSNTAVATVDNGVITAKKAGTTTITATYKGKKTTCKVTVKKKAVVKAYVSVNECYSILNNYRSNVGKIGLKRDAYLERIAEIRAKELVTKYSHTRPNGRSAHEMVSATTFGENIAKKQKSCKEVMNCWYNSDDHRENMLRTSFKKVGIAGYTYGDITYWVQIFSN